MFTQSKNEIIYQEDQWLNTMAIATALPIVAIVAWCIENSFDVHRLPTASSYATLAILPIAAAVLTGLLLKKTITLDRLIISTEGITYYHAQSERNYSWSDLSEPVFVDCGRGSGYYRIDIIDGEKPIHLNLSLFGIFRTEFEKVLSSARHGKILNVAELHAEIANSNRNIDLPEKYVIMTMILFAAALAFALYFIPPIDFN